MKRVVRLKNKENDEINTYATIVDLVRRNGEKELGICINALYNAVSANNGRWENSRYEVYYDNIDLGKDKWN